jgi:hypothetical protein
MQEHKRAETRIVAAYAFLVSLLPFISEELEQTQQRELKPRCTILLNRAIPRLDRAVEGRDHYLALEPVS